MIQWSAMDSSFLCAQW